MSELQIFNNAEFGRVKELERSNGNVYIGFYYFLEWGDLVKIGCSKKPYKRLMALKRMAENYGGLCIGRIGISQGHTNFAENEKILHKHFADYRHNDTELFSISFVDAVNSIPRDIVLKDETKEKEMKADNFLGGMKSFVLGGWANV